MPPEASEYTRFLAHWRRLPSHEYLERAAGLLARLEIGPDDSRLCAGTPASSPCAFPITINQRYVLAAWPRRTGERFGLILRVSDAQTPCAPHLSESFAFRPFRDEPEPPDWRRFDELALLDDPDLSAAWTAGAAYERDRQARSGFRRHHSRLLGELLTDAAARTAWREEGRL